MHFFVNFGWFKNVNFVGISAGASTPDYLIEEVRREIEKMIQAKKMLPS